MSDYDEVKAEHGRRAADQERSEVKRLKADGWVAHKVSKEYDVYASKDGIIMLEDCKFTDNDTFFIESKDIAKWLEQVELQAAALNYLVPVKFRVDMYFPRHKGKNRHYVDIDESHLGKTIRVDWVPGGIVTELVAKALPVEDPREARRKILEMKLEAMGVDS